MWKFGGGVRRACEGLLSLCYSTLYVYVGMTYGSEILRVTAPNPYGHKKDRGPMYGYRLLWGGYPNFCTERIYTAETGEN